MSTYAAFDWARRHVGSGRLPNAVLGVATADGTVALDAFGPVAADATYPLFSITKVLTGIAAARAIERGLLTPETPLTAAVPEFGRDRDDVVRLWHLASHSSGISEPALDTAVPLATELRTRGRDFPAGTASRYSTLGYTGIAELIAHATGRSWDAAVRDWAETIGATGITLDPDGYVPVDGIAEAGMNWSQLVANRDPGAGLFARADDLLRLATDLLRTHRDGTAGVLTPAGLAFMRRPVTQGMARLDPYPAERGQDWGFTLNLNNRTPGLISTDGCGHAGWSGTEFWLHPEHGVAYVLLTAKADRAGVDPLQLDNAVVAGV
ncbi:serine hydrolase domain-containing protein [Microbacterium halophytorum]|uniref:serine hydrolase domain-containing protein n=1 Tax=Microbacterium halophytorum TaxID=2067568 RepID=UPI000CFD2B11|nr:serine hydrolase domain-containing protein [Microbacterium halophytorum]